MKSQGLIYTKEKGPRNFNIVRVRMKQFCPQIEYFAPALVAVEHSHVGSAFAVCVMQSSLTCQLEHSSKVRSGLVYIWLWKIYFHCYQARPHFLCAALMSPQRTKQFCLQIEQCHNKTIKVL